jgi:hypothetical protein
VVAVAVAAYASMAGCVATSSVKKRCDSRMLENDRQRPQSCCPSVRLGAIAMCM